jgi:hypothetical protein
VSDHRRTREGVIVFANWCSNEIGQTKVLSVWSNREISMEKRNWPCGEIVRLREGDQEVGLIAKQGAVVLFTVPGTSTPAEMKTRAAPAVWCPGSRQD